MMTPAAERKRKRGKEKAMMRTKMKTERRVKCRIRENFLNIVQFEFINITCVDHLFLVLFVAIIVVTNQTSESI